MLCWGRGGSLQDDGAGVRVPCLGRHIPAAGSYSRTTTALHDRGVGPVPSLTVNSSLSSDSWFRNQEPQGPLGQAASYICSPQTSNGPLAVVSRCPAIGLQAVTLP